MLYLGTTPLAGMIKTKVFTASGTFVVPSDVHCLWASGCSGGYGGGGGNSTPGGGGGGGNAGMGFLEAQMPVVPGEVLSVTIGAGGVGGAANSNGGINGYTMVSGQLWIVSAGISYGGGGYAGGNPNGGNAGVTCNFSAGPAGGAAAGAGFVSFGSSGLAIVYGRREHTLYSHTSGSAGGALNFPGGVGGSIQTGGGKDASIISPATGNSSGGGGGAGGSGQFGDGGAGGSNGAAGSNATGYGAGGGGGSGNSAGGNGSPGLVRIYYISKYTVA